MKETKWIIRERRQGKEKIRVKKEKKMEKKKKERKIWSIPMSTKGWAHVTLSSRCGVSTPNAVECRHQHMVVFCGVLSFLLQMRSVYSRRKPVRIELSAVGKGLRERERER